MVISIAVLVYQRVNKFILEIIFHWTPWLFQLNHCKTVPAVIAVTSSATGTSFAQSSCSANSGQIEISSMVLLSEKLQLGSTLDPDRQIFEMFIWSASDPFGG